MKNVTLTIREMFISDLPELMRLKNDEGWNQTEQDWKLLINYKGSVNLVCEMDNKIVGTITAINYANKVAWIGMMLVDKDYRRRGISNTLLQDAIEKLKDCESIKLDATPVGHHVYEKIGFIDEFDINRITNLSISNIAAIAAVGKATVSVCRKPTVSLCNTGGEIASPDAGDGMW